MAVHKKNSYKTVIPGVPLPTATLAAGLSTVAVKVEALRF